jgi:D-inositol-3-phosphate glycosyltransferase
MRQRRLLWVGDAVAESGFSRITHKILLYLRESWHVSVLGINYLGDPHNYPYDIYPAFAGGDGFGLNRMKDLIDKIEPDLVVIMNDPWNIRAYVERAEDLPTIAIMPVDGKNCKPAKDLGNIATAIVWTQFGLDELRAGGYHGPASIIPLGVETKLYYPRNKRESRQTIGLPERMLDGFIVGTVNRNQQRKRFDLMITYFGEWIKTRQIENPFLFFHTAPTMDDVYDVQQLMAYYGLKRNLILSEPAIWCGIPEDRLATTYNCFDVMLTTTQGEGWGLTTMEGMACGIPQIVPDWSALGEWTFPAAIRVPCSSIAVTANHGINVVGGIIDKEGTLEALDQLYNDHVLRQELSTVGQTLVNQGQFNWANIAKRYAEIFESVYVDRRSPQADETYA